MGATGVEVKMAAKLGAAWGTAVAVGATNGFLIRPSSLKKSQPLQIDDSLGMGWPTDADLGEIVVDGQIVGYMRYDSLDLLIAMAMGTATTTHTVDHADSGTATGGTATTLIVSGGGFGTSDEHVGHYVTMTGGTNAGKTRKITSHNDTTLNFATMTDTVDNNDTFTINGTVTTHVYTMAEGTDGLFATLCTKLGTIAVDEVASMKIGGFTIKNEVGKAVEVAFDLLGNDRKQDSSTNTTVTIANVTFPETANRLLHRQGVIRMNDQSGAALDAGATIYPASWELSFKRKLAGAYGTASGTDQIDEPVSDGNPEIRLRMELPRFDSAGKDLLDDRTAGTAKKLDFTFTGALLGDGATARSFLLEIPNARWVDIDVPITEGHLRVPMEFAIMGVGVAPTGMTVTQPFGITMVNGYGGNPIQQGN